MKPTHWIQNTSHVAVAVAMLAATSMGAVAQDYGDEHSDKPQAQYVSDLETMESKFMDLADAMSSEQYMWRPGEGVRSVSEVFMLIVAENYIIPNSWGAPPPDGMTIERSLWTSLPEVTDKAEVQEHLQKSFTYYKEMISSLTPEQLHTEIDFFGNEVSVNEALYIIATDMHEHLGQGIAYARVNGVVPPWTARQQQGN